MKRRVTIKQRLIAQRRARGSKTAARDGGGRALLANRGADRSVFGARELQGHKPVPCCGAKRRPTNLRLPLAVHADRVS